MNMKGRLLLAMILVAVTLLREFLKQSSEDNLRNLSGKYQLYHLKTPLRELGHLRQS